MIDFNWFIGVLLALNEAMAVVGAIHIVSLFDRWWHRYQVKRDKKKRDKIESFYKGGDDLNGCS